MLYQSIKIILEGTPAQKSIALSDAAAYGDIPIVNFLIEKGADKDIALFNVIENHKCPIIYPFGTNTRDDKSAIDLLIAKGANIDNTLFYAASRGYKNNHIWLAEKENYKIIFDFLIEKGANKNIALFKAAANRHEVAFNFLIEKGANKNIALFISARNRNEITFDFLLEKGANINTALLCAAVKSDEIAFNFLIEKGANINTALLMAIKGGKDNAAYFLIEKGADKDLVNHHENNKNAALLLLSINKNKDSSKKEDHIASSSPGDDKPEDGYSNRVASTTITKKRKLDINNEEDEEFVITYSSKLPKTSDNSDSSSINKNVGRNKHSLENDKITKKKSIILELETKLDNPEVHLSQEEYELDKAQKKLINMLPKEEIIEDKEETITIKTSEIEFYSENTKIEKKESIIYQFGKWAYELLTEKTLSYELIFNDKSSMIIFPSFNYDQDLPKLDMPGEYLLTNTHETS